MRPPERLALSAYYKGLVAALEPECVEIVVPNEFAAAYLRARRDGGGGGIRALEIRTAARGSVGGFVRMLARTTSEGRAACGVRHLRLRVDVSMEPPVRGLLGAALAAFPAVETLELYAAGGGRPATFEVVVPAGHPLRRMRFEGGDPHVLRVLCPSPENRAANASRELVVRGHFDIARTAWRRVDVGVDHAEVGVREALWSVADAAVGTVVLRLGRARVVGLEGRAAAGRLACEVLEIRCHPDIRVLRVRGTSFDAVGSMVVRGASVHVIVENPSLLSRIAVERPV